jgi:hypothetical protein
VTTAQRFTQRARRVFALAQEEAERQSHTGIGEAHLLMGLICEPDGVGGAVLRDLGVTEERTRDLISKLKRGSPENREARMFDLTPRVKQCIEFAVEEARTLDDAYISTEHLLLGLLRQNDGVVIDVLRTFGLEPGRVRMAVLAARDDRRAARETGLDAPVSQTSPLPLTLEEDWRQAAALRESGRTINVHIIGHNAGGVIVNFGRLRGFVPASQLSDVHQNMLGDVVLPPEQRYQRLVGLIAETKVVEINREQNRLILSERAAIPDNDFL